MGVATDAARGRDAPPAAEGAAAAEEEEEEEGVCLPFWCCCCCVGGCCVKGAGDAGRDPRPPAAARSDVSSGDGGRATNGAGAGGCELSCWRERESPCVGYEYNVGEGEAPRGADAACAPKNCAAACD